MLLSRRNRIIRRFVVRKGLVDTKEKFSKNIVKDCEIIKT